MYAYLGMLNPFFHVGLNLKSFSSDELNMLDEALKCFISSGSSTKAYLNEPKER
jgi:hypothetical protein